jgi:hypothetical protein
MGVGEFTDARIVANIRDDAYHSVVLAATLERDHPLKKTLMYHTQEILKAIDGA